MIRLRRPYRPDRDNGLSRHGGWRHTANRPAADEAAIAAEEARDRTTTGRERAAQARAAVPTPQAKAAVWRELMEDVSMPNETQVKTLRGFNDVERRPELLAPFVEEYARRILTIWDTRTFHMAENLL